MRASRVSDAQTAFILKQGNNGILIAEICRKAEISRHLLQNGRRDTMCYCRWECGV
jgi:putative transposase